MSRALISILIGLFLLGLGVYFLLTRDKLDNINDEIRTKQNDIEKLSKEIDIIDMKLLSIEKPIILINKYSNKFISFLKKYEK